MTWISRAPSLFSALAVLIWLLAAPAPAVATPSAVSAPASPAAAQEPVLNCDILRDTEYWFCRGLQGRNCNLVERDDYWLCRSLVESKCAFADREDYWTCRALTERKCNFIDEALYWTCRGLTENCDLGPREEHAFCRAIGPFFRTPRP